MWELNHKKGWASKNWCLWTMVLEKTLQNPLDSKEIKPVHPKGNQLSVHWKDWCWSWSSNTLATWCEQLTYWKNPDSGKDWRQKEKRASENEIAGWHHQFNGHEFEQAPGVCQNLCSLHWWCHSAISSSDSLFSFCLQSFPASGTFPMSVCLHQMTKILVYSVTIDPNR